MIGPQLIRQMICLSSALLMIQLVCIRSVFAQDRRECSATKCYTLYKEMKHQRNASMICREKHERLFALNNLEEYQIMLKLFNEMEYKFILIPDKCCHWWFIFCKRPWILCDPSITKTDLLQRWSYTPTPNPCLNLPCCLPREVWFDKNKCEHLGSEDIVNDDLSSFTYLWIGGDWPNGTLAAFSDTDESSTENKGFSCDTPKPFEGLEIPVRCYEMKKQKHFFICVEKRPPSTEVFTTETGALTETMAAAPMQDNKALYPAVGGSIGALAVLVAIIVVIFILYRKRHSNNKGEETNGERAVENPSYEIQDEVIGIRYPSSRQPYENVNHPDQTGQAGAYDNTLYSSPPRREEHETSLVDNTVYSRH